MNLQIWSTLLPACFTRSWQYIASAEKTYMYILWVVTTCPYPIHIDPNEQLKSWCNPKQLISHLSYSIASWPRVKIRTSVWSYLTTTIIYIALVNMCIEKQSSRRAYLQKQIKWKPTKGGRKKRNKMRTLHIVWCKVCQYYWKMVKKKTRILLLSNTLTVLTIRLEMAVAGWTPLLCFFDDFLH